MATDTPPSQPGSSPGSSLPERIGNTPLLRLDQIARLLPSVQGPDSVTLLAKAERANPGGSVKDRAAAGRSATIVTVLPDSTDKYLSARFWEEE